MRPVVALVPAAGRGVRLGESTPKAFVPVGGTPMVRLAVDGLIASGAVHLVVVVVPAELVDAASALLSSTSLTGDSMPPVPVRVVVGGAERTDSVRAGIAAAPDAGYYLVHDAARALTPPTLIARVAAELQAGRPAVVPALPVVDTVKSVDAAGAVTGTPDRALLRAIQTPQGFDADLLRRAYATDLAATDDAGLVERLGATVHTVAGDPLAFKITTPLDLTLAEAVLARRRDAPADATASLESAGTPEAASADTTTQLATADSLPGGDSAQLSRSADRSEVAK